MNKMSEILEGLIKRTAEEKLAWQTSADPNAFVTAVGGISIVIRSFDRSLGESHRLEIQNDRGITVQVLQTRNQFIPIHTEDTATSEQSQELRRLFNLARKSALKLDSTLDQLAKSLASY